MFSSALTFPLLPSKIIRIVPIIELCVYAFLGVQLLFYFSFGIHIALNVDLAPAEIALCSVILYHQSERNTIRYLPFCLISPFLRPSVEVLNL